MFFSPPGSGINSELTQQTNINVLESFGKLHDVLPVNVSRTTMGIRMGTFCQALYINIKRYD